MKAVKIFAQCVATALSIWFAIDQTQKLHPNEIEKPEKNNRELVTERSEPHLVQQPAKLDTGVQSIPSGPMFVRSAPKNDRRNRAPDRPDVATAQLFGGNPEFRKTYLEACRAEIRLLYGPFFKNVRMSAAEIEQFERIILANREKWTEIHATANTSNELPLAQADVDKLEAENDASLKSELGKSLGTEKFRQLEEFRASAIERQYVNALIGALHATDTALQPHQGEVLVQLLARSQLNVTKQGGALSFPDQVRFEDMLAEARTILTERQLDVFRSVISVRYDKITSFKKSADSRNK